MGKKFRSSACGLALGAMIAAGAPTPAAAQDCFLGEIRYFGGNFAPRNWAFAHGQLLAISSNTALFSILGTTYGGDGRTTFGLPDLRGRAAVSQGTGPGLPSNFLGQKFGAETVTPTLGIMPSHTHGASTTATLRASSAAGEFSQPTGRVLANDGRDRIYNAGPANTTMNANSVEATTTLANAGTASPQSFNIVQPSLALNPIVCLQGFFPSRSLTAGGVMETVGVQVREEVVIQNRAAQQQLEAEAAAAAQAPSPKRERQNDEQVR